MTTTTLHLDTQTVAAVPSDRTGPSGRWVLHRAGLLNVWQYGREELRFGGGRLLLRGKNGAGKSKALEILLPFLLDGDTRRLDATARDRTTVHWLMTDGRPPGNHVGYVWLELRCEDDDGEERFLTIGSGLKASTATRRGDAWFFITERRVGVDLELDRAGECLSVDRLKETIGEEAVTMSGAEHRRRVGRHVFGLFDDARYGNLLHLLHRLRDPNIGNRVEAGELANVLSEALPPIDETVLVDGAGRFDDLETIREQVERSQRTADALGRFLGTYRGYARTVLRRRGLAVEAGEAKRAAAQRALRQAERARADAEQAVVVADDALQRHEAARVAAEDDRRALERSDAYRAHQDLVDRQARVDALGAADETAAAAARRAAEASARAASDAAAAEAATRAAFGETVAAGRVVGDTAGAAGMERAALVPSLSAGVDGGVPESQLGAASEQVRRGGSLVDTRRRRAGEVRALAIRAERAAADGDAADLRAAASEAELERARDEVIDARRTRDGTEQIWAAAVSAWTGDGLAGSAGVAWSHVLAVLADRDGRPGWPDEVRAGVIAAIEPALRAARSAAATAAADVVTAEHASSAAASALAELEAEAEARPEASRYRSAERDPAAGTPFYQLVDVRHGVEPGMAAGVEAALAASGLLDAWVSADGVVAHPRTEDVIVRADGAEDIERPGASLADVLEPAAVEGSPVGEATVRAVLSSIGYGERSDATTWVTADGRWSLGLLRGAWSKNEVEFLGAGARQLTRQRRLTELRAAVETAAAALRAAAEEAAGAAQHRDRLESLPQTLPPATEVATAGQDVVASERALAGARSRHDDDRRRAESARAIANRIAAELAHEAGGDDLPITVDALDGVIEALGELRQAVGEQRRAFDALIGHHERWLARRADVVERDAEAAAASHDAAMRRAVHESASHELATLRAALGTSVASVLAELADIGRRLDELQHQLIPSAHSDRDDAIAGRSEATTQVTVATDAEDGAAAESTAAVEALVSTVALPGVVLAATGREQRELDGGGDDPLSTARHLLALVDGDDDVADSTVLARYDGLSQDLAGGYDTAIDEVDGVKVVHVDDDQGRQPLATVARRLAEEADAARTRLAAREREVLERFLLRELADEVRSKLLDAHDLVDGTNRTLADVRTSHGKGARLDWVLRDDAAAPAAVAARLLVDELRGEEGDARLRDALLALIDAQRAADPSASYEQHLRTALDYRAWYRFAVRVTDAAEPSSARLLSTRLGLSQGEQRVLSYLALFAAVAAQFDAIGRVMPTAPRLLLLDDAFAKVDEPTHGRLLGLLVELGLDFVMTSERLWGCFQTVPSLEIYEAIRDPAQVGVALVHFRWDGRQRSLVGV